MNVFHKYTRQSLKANRTRTIVTIIGIILSMSMFTAVIEGAYSGIKYMQRAIIEKEGNWHGIYRNMTRREAEELRAEKEIDKMTLLGYVGWAEIGSKNTTKPYLYINSFEENLTELLAIHMVSGRMPENNTEILLPTHLATNGNVVFAIGDELTLQVGERADEGGSSFGANDERLYEQWETVLVEAEKTYTVVGFYERLDYSIEGYMCPGYTALTTGEDTPYYRCFFTVKHPTKFYEYVNGRDHRNNLTWHSDLLAMYGITRYSTVNSVIIGFAAILILLIMFGSISLIYNSFSISVSERTKQFGILKSVGSTKKQIRSSVLYEAGVLSMIGIPAGMVVGCTGIGITLWCLRDAFNSFFNSFFNEDSAVKMKLVLHPGMLAIAALICLLTTMIAAWIPAKRAIRISAMEAIRQSEDVKIKVKNVRTSKLTEKLFGFEGMMAAKNFKRNKKRYRAVVISLFMSITLFISASSFCDYLISAVDTVNSNDAGIDLSYYTIGEEQAEPEEMLAILKSVGGVTHGIYSKDFYEELRFSGADTTEECLFLGEAQRGDEMPEESADQLLRYYASIKFVCDDEFIKYCNENGIVSADYFDRNHPKALFYNRMTITERNGDKVTWKTVPMLKKGKNEWKVTSSWYGFRNADMYVASEEVSVDEVLFVPYEVLSEYWECIDENKPFPPALEEKIIRKTKEEATFTQDFTIGALTEKPIFSGRASEAMLIYPYSMLNAVFADEEIREQFGAGKDHETTYYFTAEDHKASYADMKEKLSERNLETARLTDYAADRESERMMVTIINVFSYGFIILISLIAIANVFNTISTNINLRRREFAMLKSIGMSQKGFLKMMNYECLIYGIKGLVWGLPASFLMTYGIYRVTEGAVESGFYIPWYSIAIAVGSVFIVVFATMFYAMSKIKKDNPIDALKNENL